MKKHLNIFIMGFIILACTCFVATAFFGLFYYAFKHTWSMWALGMIVFFGICYAIGYEAKSSKH